MRIITTWASQHRWTARLLIATGDILLTLLGITIGLGLFQQDISFTTTSIVVIAWVMLITFYLFPKNYDISDAMGFVTPRLLRTACHFVLYFTAFLLFVAVGNRLPNKVYGYPVPQAPLPAFIAQSGNPPIPPELRLNQKPGAAQKAMLVKYDLKETVQVITLHQDIQNGPGSWLMLSISSLAATIIALLLAGLSCNILCSGTEAAASLASLVGLGVWIGGVVLFGLLVVRIVR